jgi:two-component system C4-dicarboxylate transport sensor histidine kinase DctB
MLRISDNGLGIENLENIFEPFYTTKEPGDGLGLGLSISSSIITDYGGRLIARNNEPSGAIFEFELPLIKENV